MTCPVCHNKTRLTPCPACNPRGGVPESDRIVPRYDNINPPHYQAANGLESIDVIEAFFPSKPYRWAAMKYLIRAGKKPGQDEVQDLRKAIWWIEREIAWIEKRNSRPCDSRPDLDGRNGFGETYDYAAVSRSPSLSRPETSGGRGYLAS